MTRLFFIILLSLSLAACHDKTSGTRGDDSSAVATARPQTPIDTVKQVVMRAQQQNKLYTTECKVHKVVLFSDTGKSADACSTSTSPATAKWPCRWT